MKAMRGDMERGSVEHDLAVLLTHPSFRGRILLYRGEEERARLVEWLDREAPPAGRRDDGDLRGLIEECNRCPGASEKKMGIGTGENRVMVILNSPPLVNLVEKKMLRAESVELMKKMLGSAGIDFSASYITNLVKCEVRDPVLKPSQVVSNCERIIMREIEVLAPRVALVFGDIMPLQRIIKMSADVFWYNIEHPITIIKNPELKRPAWNTLKLVMAKLKELNLP